MGVAAGAGRLVSESLQEPGVSSRSRCRSRASLGVVSGAGRLLESLQEPGASSPRSSTFSSANIVGHLCCEPGPVQS